jgi:DNA-binding NarL/FixJ family response regulator
MMTQEEFMDVLAMKRQGMSFKEIGEELGYHPATIAKWVKAVVRLLHAALLRPTGWLMASGRTG